MADEIVDLDAQNQEEVVTQDEPKQEVTETAEVEPKDEVDVETLKKTNQNLYERLRKAEGFERNTEGKWVKKEAPKPVKEVKGADDITQTELYSLIKADVHQEDVNEVLLYARSHNISVPDALKTAEVKAILGIQADYRKTAEASSTKNTRTATLKVDDSQILSDIAEGKLPDADKLADLRQKQRIERRAK